MTLLKDYLDYEQPTKYIVNDDNYSDDYEIPVLTAGQSFILGYTNEKEGVFPKEKLPIILFDDFTTSVQYVDFPFKVKSSALKILLPKENANIKYFYYLLKNVDFDSTVHKRYWISEFEKMSIPDISIKEQDEIVEKLDIINYLIENRKKIINDLKKYNKSKYNELFNEEKVEWIRIGDIFDVVTGGTPSKKNDDYWTNGTIPWIGSNMCYDEPIYENDGKYITELGLKNSNTKLLPSGTVCIALVGATIGKTALLKFDTCTNQNIAGILVNNNPNYTSEFVFYSLQMNYYIFESMGKGFNMANLKDIRNLKIPSVSIDEQIKFQKIVEQSEILIKKASNELKNLESLLANTTNKYIN